MSPIALAVRHLAFEDLGLLDPLLRARGYAVRYLDVAVEPIDPDELCGADLLVVLGGPISADDTDRYPFLGAELAALRARLGTRRPTLGICLGAQLLARALDATVEPGPAPEIGYARLELTAEGLASPLRHIADVPVLHWHNDCFALPEGARHLAATASCPHQAFAIGTHVLGLQFHLEVDHRDIEHWLVGHAEALYAAGIDPRALRADASTVGLELNRRAIEVVGEWLDG